MSKFIALIFLFAMSRNMLAQEISELYKDPTADIDDRINDLISRMTLKEKIGQMTQLNISLINTTGKQKDVELNIKKARKYIKDHHIGSFLNGEAVSAEDWFQYSRALQKIAVEETRLGIPIIYGIDHMHGASYLEGATIFPHNINLAATFDPFFAAQTGRITSTESADLGHHWIFAPVLDLGRNPHWPRFYETYGESYFVASQMGKAFVSSLIQNPDIAPYQQAATGKHFIGYSVPRSGWDRTPVDLSDQALYEFHVPSFKAAMEAGLQTIMLNSGEINGIPVHASKHIIQDILRDNLDFEGVVLTDWDDIGKLVNYHHTAKDYTEATEMAVNAGIDMSMTPTSLDFNNSLLELVETGRIQESRLDESVRRILKLKFELGLFEHPYPRNDRFERIGSKAHRAIAKAASDESIVLLKNESDLLPVSKSVKKILLLGPSADVKPELAGGWTISWQGGKPEQYPKDMTTVYTALEKEFPNTSITLLAADASSELIASEALKNDLTIIAFGEKTYTEFVGNITSLELPEEQQSLIKMASSAGKPIVGIFIGGRPRIVSSVIDDIDAFIWAGLPGFEGATSIAEIISGKVNPSGKLPFSYPYNEGHFVTYDHKPSAIYHYNEEDANFIAQEEQNVWQWPFGSGLSYTEFTYSNFRLSNKSLTEEATLTASLEVTNTGGRAGKESIIWYIKDHVGSISRPVKEVKHFDKISLKPGESKIIEFTIIPERDLSYPDRYGNEILESGTFSIIVNGKKLDFEFIKNQRNTSN